MNCHSYKLLNHTPIKKHEKRTLKKQRVRYLNLVSIKLYIVLTLLEERWFLDLEKK